MPMISWDREGNLLNKDESLVQEGLDAIRKYSIYDDEDECDEEDEPPREVEDAADRAEEERA